MVDDTVWDEVYEYLEGTSNTEFAAIEYFDLDCEPGDVIEAMLDRNLEPCPECGWWTESGELTDDDSNPESCGQCRELRGNG